MPLVSRLEVVVTIRLHGLVLALRAGVPALAIDPVAGGGKVTAQAGAWGWPMILAAEDTADRARLDGPWEWCLSAAGRAAAACTERLRISCAVFVTTLHSPVHLAKSLSTLDSSPGPARDRGRHRRQGAAVCRLRRGPGPARRAGSPTGSR